MKKPLLAVVLVAAALATLGNAGLKLAGALRQIDAIARTNLHAQDTTAVEAAKRAAPLGRARVAIAASAVPSTGHAAPVPELPASEPEGSAASRFDAEAAIHAAGERDPKVAELLADPDPGVGAAIRDFINNIEPPGASADFR
jgi:hypothetical protein